MRLAQIGMALWIVTFLSSVRLFGTESFTFFSSSRNRSFTVQTTLLGPALNFPGHWMYQPSVITPSTLTNNQYVMLLNSNLVAGIGEPSGEAILMATSSDGVTFGLPQVVLTNTVVDNICDMIDARPIWGGVNWHVYVQARRGITIWVVLT